MMDLENAPAFSRFCAAAIYDPHLSGAKPKFRIFFPQLKYKHGSSVGTPVFFASYNLMQIDAQTLFDSGFNTNIDAGSLQKDVEISAALPFFFAVNG